MPKKQSAYKPPRVKRSADKIAPQKTVAAQLRVKTYKGHNARLIIEKWFGRDTKFYNWEEQSDRSQIVIDEPPCRCGSVHETKVTLKYRTATKDIWLISNYGFYPRIPVDRIITFPADGDEKKMITTIKQFSNACSAAAHQSSQDLS